MALPQRRHFRRILAVAAGATVLPGLSIFQSIATGVAPFQPTILTGWALAGGLLAAGLLLLEARLVRHRGGSGQAPDDGQTVSTREEHPRRLLDCTPVGYQSLNEKGCLADVNQTWLDMLGYTRGEVVGKPFSQFLAPAYREHFRKGFPRFKESGEVHGSSFKLVRKDGTTIDAEFDGRVARNADGSFQATHCVFRDVTEQKRAERALKKERLVLTRVIEENPFSIGLYDADGHFMRANQAFRDLFGAEPPPEYSLLTDPILHREGVQDLLLDLKSKPSPTAFPDIWYDVHEVDPAFPSKPVFIRGVAFPIMDADGQVENIVAVHEDCTVRKQAEDALGESEGRFRTLFDNVFDALMIVETSGTIVGCNRTLRTMLGYSKEELVGLPAERIHPPAEMPKIYRGVEELMTTGSMYFRYVQLLAKTGEIIEAETGAMKVKFGDETCILVSFRNATERKKAEEALEQAEERFRLLTQATRDIIYDWDIIGNRLWFNERHREVLGSAGPDFREWRAERLHPEDRDRVATVLEDLLRGGAHHSEVEYRLRLASGRYADITDKGFVIRDSSGRAVRMIGAMIDMSERKRTEDLALLQRDLGMVLSSTSDLKEAAEHVMRAAMRIEGIDCAGVYFVDDVTGGIDLIAVSGVSPEFERSVAHYGRETAQARLVRDGKPYYGSYVPFSAGPDGVCQNEGLRAFTALPIRYRRTSIAALNLASRSCDELPPGSRAAVELIASMVGDAFARIKAEHTLRESEERFRDLAELFPEVIFEADTKGTLTYTNHAGFTTYGYSPEDLDRGLDVMDMIVPSDRSRARQSFAAILFGENLGAREYTSRRKDGSTFPVAINCNRVVRDGRTIGVRGVSSDVTEFKRAERALRERFEFETLVTGISSCFINLAPSDIDRGIDDALRQIGEYAGVDRSYVFQLNDDGSTMDNTHEWCADGIRSHIHRLKGVSTEAFAWIMNRLRSGECVYVPKVADLPVEAEVEREEFELEGIQSIVLVPAVYAGQTIGFLGFDSVRAETVWTEETMALLKIAGEIFIGAIKRKQAQEALRESEERFRAVVEAAPDSIFVKDTNLKYVQANPAMGRVFSIPPSKIVGLTDTDIFGPEVAADIREADLAVLAGQTIQGEHTVFIRGVPRTFSVAEMPMRNANGEVVAICGISREMTEKRKMEEDMARAQKLESLGLLAGGIAHDFNNILTAILGNVSVAKMDLAPGGETYNALSDTEKAALQAQSLTQQLLTFSRGGAPVKAVVFIGDVIREAASFALSGSKVRCEYSFPDGLWSVEVDRGQIGQVIQNLVINADQAMPDGGIIRVSTQNVGVAADEPLPLRPGRYVKISVQDEGVGIPHDHLSRVFDPYFTTKQKGNGLGLATTYSIMKRHDGYISVQSELGVGTIFTLYLPATDKVAPAETGSAEKPARGTGRVLVLDDEPIIRDVVSRMLTRLGYSVDCVADGAEVVARYRQAIADEERFDVVIMDLTIPGGMGGKEAIAALREIDPNVKAIVSSGYSDDTVMADFALHGFAGRVAKPYRTLDLSKALQSVLSKKETPVI